MTQRLRQSNDSQAKYSKDPKILGISFSESREEYILIYQKRFEVFYIKKQTSKKITPKSLKCIYDAKLQFNNSLLVWVIGEYLQSKHKIICINTNNKTEICCLIISESFTFRKFDIFQNKIAASFGKSKCT
jgi:hypothetical protein